MKQPETLADRLASALQKAGKSPADLVKLTELSRTAVGKWMDGSSENLKLVHLYKVADFLGVEARWLAIGEGEMKPSKTSTCTHSDIPPQRISLIRLYSTLPDSDRAVARRMIETMAWFAHPHREDYLAKMAQVSLTSSKAPASPSSGQKPSDPKKPAHRAG